MHDYEQHLQLKTGEDAIMFFARYGNSTPIKFVYCNRTKPPVSSPLFCEGLASTLAFYRPTERGRRRCGTGQLPAV